MVQHQAAAANDSTTKRRSPDAYHNNATDKVNAPLKVAIDLLLIYNNYNNYNN